MRANVIIATVLFAMFAAERDARALPFTFETLPVDGTLVAEVGATEGWGYTLTNTSDTLWLLVTDVAHDPVVHGVMDTSPFDFPLLAPNASATLPYDRASALGLAQFTWDASAPVAFINAGLFVLGGEFYTDDPFAGGRFVMRADLVTAPYSIEARRTAIPEPGGLLLFGIACALGAARRRRRRVARFVRSG